MATPVRWDSYHVFLPSHADAFLTDGLLPLVEAWTERQLLKRFFFTRQSEAGLHLRVRLQFHPDAGVDCDSALVTAVRPFQPKRPTLAGSVRVERVPYDRGLHYFGETPYSVYAELINVETSWLALRVLRRPRRGHGMLHALAVIEALLRLSSSDDGDYARNLDDSLAFIQRALQRLGPPMPVELPEQLPPDLGGALARAVSQLASDPNVARSVRLLDRLKRHGTQGPGVATHAIHLVCNKLGLSLARERYFLSVLAGNRQLGVAI